MRRDVVTSTNEVAKELVAGGAEPGTVIVASKQVAGRGRFGRGWASPRGGLYLSLLLREDLERLPLVSLATALAVLDGLRPLGVDPVLKWPNDVLLGEAKVAGILVEGLVAGEAYWGLVGVGINSDVPLERLPADLDVPATTVRHVLGERVDNDALLDGFLAAFRVEHDGLEDPEPLVDRYREACTTLGRPVRVRTAAGVLEGRAVDVDAQGFLVLETTDGRRVEVAEGTVRHRG